MNKSIETQDINIAAILTTVDGIELKTLSFELYKGEVSAIFCIEHSERLQPVVDRMIWQYGNKTLNIDEKLVHTTLTGLKAYQHKKVQQLQKMLSKNKT